MQWTERNSTRASSLPRWNCIELNPLLVVAQVFLTAIVERDDFPKEDLEGSCDLQINLVVGVETEETCFFFFPADPDFWEGTSQKVWGQTRKRKKKTNTTDNNFKGHGRNSFFCEFRTSAWSLPHKASGINLLGDIISLQAHTKLWLLNSHFTSLCSICCVCSCYGSEIKELHK